MSSNVGFWGSFSFAHACPPPCLSLPLTTEGSSCSLKYYYQSFRVVVKYPLLIGILPCIIVSVFAGSGMASLQPVQLLMGPLRFRQNELLIPSLVGMIFSTFQPPSTAHSAPHLHQN